MKKKIALIIIISICLILVLVIGGASITGRELSPQNNDIVENIIIALITLATGLLMSTRK